MVNTNPFIREGLKQTAKTSDLGNGAIKYLTTGSDFVDQFGKINTYRQPRSYEQISQDMYLLWSQNHLLTLAFVFYIRMITRIVQLPSAIKTSTTQRGQGLKYEGIMRMTWIALNAPETFWKNITLFIAVGSWKDIILMLSYDIQQNGWDKKKLNWPLFGQLLIAGLENPNSTNLVKKYIPHIKAKSLCNTPAAKADTIIAKWLCSLLFNTSDENKVASYKQYQNLKASGTAHQWQQLISQSNFLEINFDSIHGRALAQLVSSKFLANHKLEEKYETWVESKPLVKFTGYVYELFAPVKSGYINNKLKKYQISTINKQFYGLIETAKNGMNRDSSLIVVVDSSSSMTHNATGIKSSSYDIAKSMALYFSYLLEGKFNKAWMEFNDTCELKYWKGNTPVENLQNDRSEAYGSTNFQGVGETFVKLLKRGVSEEEFPTGILCISDGCFNPKEDNQESNYDLLIETLSQGGFSKEYVNNFKVILWDIPNGYYGKPQTAFEDFADTPNLFYMSGLDGSAIAFILGTEYNPTIPKTAEELFLAAMNQEVLSLLEV